MNEIMNQAKAIKETLEKAPSLEQMKEDLEMYRKIAGTLVQKIKEEAELDSLNKMFASFSNTDNVLEKDIDISDASVDNFLSAFLKNK